MYRTGESPLKTLVYGTRALILMLSPNIRINVQAGKHRVFNGLWGVESIENYVGPPNQNQWT